MNLPTASVGWRRASGIVMSTVALAIALPAAADAACTPSSVAGRTVFSAFGDSASYVLAPGGSFESGTSGWTLSGASVTSGNESYFLNSPADGHSLWITAGGTAISAPFCVSSDQPTFRFVARQASGTWSEMNVHVLWTNSSGAGEDSVAGGLAPSESWSPSPSYDLGSMLPTESGQTYSVRVEFVPAAGGGAVSVDDLFVDPYSRG